MAIEDENERGEIVEEEPEVEETEDEPEVDIEDEEGDKPSEDTEGSSEQSSADNSTGTKDGGSGATDAKTPVVGARPTGKDLLDMLAGDDEAKTLMSRALEEARVQREADEQARKDQEEFQALIDAKDYSAIGERLVERQVKEKARSEVADDVLKEQFEPVYTRLLAQPEMADLTAEEKESLNPRKFKNDAEYVTGIQDFIANKRFEARINTEVEKRFKARLEAKGNEEVAAKAKVSVGATPKGVGDNGMKHMSSADKIRSGLRAIINPDADGDDD